MAFKLKRKKERLTEKRLSYLIQDEKKASSEYKKYGFTTLSKDEKEHQRFLEALSEKRKKNEDDGEMNVGKLQLPKSERKNSLYLPVENVVYIPSTYGVKEQKNVSKAEMDKRVGEVKTFFSNNFGGYTSVKATGGYVLKNGKLVNESVIKVTSFSTKEDFEKNKSKLFNQIGDWGKDWGQERVGYENEGDLYYIGKK